MFAERLICFIPKQILQIDMIFFLSQNKYLQIDCFCIQKEIFDYKLTLL